MIFDRDGQGIRPIPTLVLPLRGNHETGVLFLLRKCLVRLDSFSAIGIVEIPSTSDVIGLEPFHATHSQRHFSCRERDSQARLVVVWKMCPKFQLLQGCTKLESFSGFLLLELIGSAVSHLTDPHCIGNHSLPKPFNQNGRLESVAGRKLPIVNTSPAIQSLRSQVMPLPHGPITAQPRPVVRRRDACRAYCRITHQAVR